MGNTDTNKWSPFAAEQGTMREFTFSWLPIRNVSHLGKFHTLFFEGKTESITLVPG